MANDSSSNFSMAILARIDEAIDRADAKCATIAAGNAGLLSVLIAVIVIVAEKDLLSLNRTGEYLFLLWISCYFATSLISTFYAFVALFPRLTPDSTSILYFGFLGQHTNADKLVEQIEGLSEDQIHRQIAEQIMHTSRIAQMKYLLLRKSIFFLLLNGILWTLTMIGIFLLFGSTIVS